MADPKRPPGVPASARLLRVWVDIGPEGFAAKFHHGSGVGLNRANPEYYDVIGRWFCAGVEAPKIGDRPDCRPAPPAAVPTREGRCLMTTDYPDNLDYLRAYAASPGATAEGVAARINRLDAGEWDEILEWTSDRVPLPDDGRAALALGDGGEGWSVLWWDAGGRRVIGRYDVTDGTWCAGCDEPAGEE